MKCYKGNLFIAPASYFIKNLKGQEKRKFANEVFQYDGMVCGMVEEINVEYTRLLASFKAQDENYVDQVLTLSIDYYGADLSKFHRVRSVKKINFFNFLKIKEQDIIDIIKNKDYD